MGRVSVSSCRCMFVCCVHPVAVLNAAFCMTCSLLMLVEDAIGDHAEVILQVNINGLRNKLEELKLLIHDTHADIITIQETMLTLKAKTPKIHNFTSVRTDRPIPEPT